MISLLKKKAIAIGVPVELRSELKSKLPSYSIKFESYKNYTDGQIPSSSLIIYNEKHKLPFLSNDHELNVKSLSEVFQSPDQKRTDYSETVLSFGVPEASRTIIEKNNPNCYFDHKSFKDVSKLNLSEIISSKNILINPEFSADNLINIAKSNNLKIHDCRKCHDTPLGEDTLLSEVDFSLVFTNTENHTFSDTSLTEDTFFDYFNNGIKNGIRTKDFFNDVEKGFVLFSNEQNINEYIKSIRTYLNYIWEGSPISENFVNLCDRTLSEISNSGRVPSDNLINMTAAVNAQFGNYKVAKELYNKSKSKMIATEYLNLSHVLHHLGSKNKEFEKNSEIYQTFEANQHKIFDLIAEANGDVAIVGNGPQEIGKNLGYDIDNKNLVIRFNTFDTSFPISQDYGTKTDVWVRMIPHPYVKHEPDLRNIKQVLITGGNRMYRKYTNWDWMYLNHKKYPNLSFIPTRPFLDLTEKLGTYPTSGLYMAYLLYTQIGPLKEDNVFGSSFADANNSSGGYHYSDNLAYLSNRHDFDAEKEFFKSISNYKEKSYYHCPIVTFNKSTSEIKQKSENSKIVSDWNAKNFISEFNEIYTTSKGLTDYSLNNKQLDLFSNEKETKNNLILGFGLRGTGQKALKLQEEKNANIALTEYGFISGTSIPSKTDFKFSLIVDDLGIFFDTTKNSRIVDILSNNQDILDISNKDRARNIINIIKDNNLVKYNDAEFITYPTETDKNNILVVDQTKGDLSISLGGCEKYSFDDMLEEALKQPNSKVFLKLHPETIQGAKDANFDINKLKLNPNIHLITENCNMMHLLKQMDEVYVMTSGTGVEALIANKKVTCFGKPFYSGWGLTNDKQDIDRSRNIELESLIYAFFINYTLWFNPSTREQCEVEEALTELINLLNT